MMLRAWEALPEELRTDAVRPYYEILKKKQAALLIKRIFDVVVSSVMLLLLLPLFLILGVAIKLDSPGPVFYRQTRVTQYGKEFRIFKFRSMVADADKSSLLTVGADSRITRVGRAIRKYRLDEICQLIDIFRGTMTFVGTRPEVPKYVASYTPEMMATLLLPAGVTSIASIRYKNEDALLAGADDVDKVYIEQVLPGKMAYNLRALREFGFWKEILVIFGTVAAVIKKENLSEETV